MKRRIVALFGALTILQACQTTVPVKELKLVGFEEDVGKGKSVGEVEGGDCVYMILGYWLGGAPTLSKAFANARKQRTTSVSESVGGNADAGDALRYMNNVTVKDEGFNAVVFGKYCLMVSGMGFK
jgi:hypothetical protein